MARFAMEKWMKIAAIGIIFQKNRSEVLLVKRRDLPVWVLPGGGIEAEETPEEACIREVFEETGYTVRIERKVAAYLPVNALTQLTHFFECSITQGTAKIGEETEEVAFFPLTALPKLLPPPFAGWIADAAKNLPYFEKEITGVTYGVLLKALIQHPFLVGRYLYRKWVS